MISACMAVSVRELRTAVREWACWHTAVVVMGTTGIKDTHTPSLYELAFTAMRSVSGHCCEVKQRRARLVAGWVTQALEQGRLGSCAHAGYNQYYTAYKKVDDSPESPKIRERIFLFF